MTWYLFFSHLQDDSNMSSLKIMAQKVVISSGLESSQAPGYLKSRGKLLHDHIATT